MTKPFFVGGASMPRSGHHFLHRIFMAYFGDSFGYCSYYYPWKHDFFPECCGKNPCSKYAKTDLSVFFQKSHDFDLSDPVDQADLNIIQIRKPIERLYSNFELHIKSHPQNDKRANFRQFAQREFYYYIAFWQKWVANAKNNTLVMTYEYLCAFPLEQVSRVFEAIGVDVDQVKLQSIIDEQSATKGGESKYVPRKVNEHKFYDFEWTKEYSQKLRSACLGYAEIFDDKT